MLASLALANYLQQRQSSTLGSQTSTSEDGKEPTAVGEQILNAVIQSQSSSTTDQLPMSSSSTHHNDRVPKEPFESVMAEFRLSNDTLRQAMAHMHEELDAGLLGGAKSSTIAMLPSFVPELPDGTGWGRVNQILNGFIEEGKFVAMDLGGTNLRVMIMDILPGGKIKTVQFNTRVPTWAMHGTGIQLFDFLAKCLADFLIEKEVAQLNLPVGFTFSYPCDQTGLRSAKLLHWTKGFASSGVVGEDVVRLLEEAIERHGGILVQIVALVNDTVGTMVAAAQEVGGICHLGVIIGTGTNAAYMERIENIKTVHSLDYPHKQMIIDTEWGGFGDRMSAEYLLTQYDRIIDARSEHPGVNTLDKLIAGMCLGELVRLVLEKLARNGILFPNSQSNEILYTINKFPTKYISEILNDEGGSYVNTRQITGELGIDEYSFSDLLLLREVCMVVSRRSANIASAAIACFLNRIRQPKMNIGIDGSTYKYHPFYHFWVTEKLKELLDPGLEFSIIKTGDGSGRGAALITAIIDRLNKKNSNASGDQILDKNQLVSETQSTLEENRPVLLNKATDNSNKILVNGALVKV